MAERVIICRIIRKSCCFCLIGSGERRMHPLMEVMAASINLDGMLTWLVSYSHLHLPNLAILQEGISV